jgi:hypothetical protein
MKIEELDGENKFDSSPEGGGVGVRAAWNFSAPVISFADQRIKKMITNMAFRIIDQCEQKTGLQSFILIIR